LPYPKLLGVARRLHRAHDDLKLREHVVVMARSMLKVSFGDFFAFVSTTPWASSTMWRVSESPSNPFAIGALRK